MTSPNKEAGRLRVSKLAFERYRLLSLICQSGMGKVIATAAAAIALGPFSAVAIAPGVAQAAPCAGVGADPGRCGYCQFLVDVYHTSNAGVCNEERRPARPRRRRAGCRAGGSAGARATEPAAGADPTGRTAKSPAPEHDSGADPEDPAGPRGAQQRPVGGTAEGPGCAPAGGRGRQDRTGNAD